LSGFRFVIFEVSEVTYHMRIICYTSLIHPLHFWKKSSCLKAAQL